MKKVKLVLWFLYITFILTGCTSQKQEEIKIVMPPPPEEPRLFYVTSYRGEANFVKNSALDAFLGEQQKGLGKNLFKPYGVAAKEGVIYVTDTAMALVFVIDPKNKKVSFLGEKPPGKLALPVGIAIDSKGIVYVSDSKQKKVFGYDKNGNLVFALGEKGEFRRPSGIAINNNLNRIYVVDTKSHNVKVYDLKTKKLLFEFGKRGKEEGEFNFPTNIAIDRETNNVAVVDTQNFRVQIFDEDGEFLTKFGRLGNVPGMFARPKGIGIDSEDHLYVADAAFNNVQIFDEQGRLLLFFGGAGFDPGKFYLPAGIYVDEEDRVYIVDSFNARVQVYQYVSEKWKKANPKKYQELKEYKKSNKKNDENKKDR